MTPIEPGSPEHIALLKSQLTEMTELATWALARLRTEAVHMEETGASLRRQIDHLAKAKAIYAAPIEADRLSGKLEMETPA